LGFVLGVEVGGGGGVVVPGGVVELDGALFAPPVTPLVPAAASAPVTGAMQEATHAVHVSRASRAIGVGRAKKRIIVVFDAYGVS
jgi:hypothetical protein